MWVFQITLLTNFVTFAATLWFAIRRPNLYFWTMAGVALCATGAALQQVFAAKANIFALLFTTVLVLMMGWRLSSIRRGSNRRL
jgi:predicted benzoate:H+ symporter BenE